MGEINIKPTNIPKDEDPVADLRNFVASTVRRDKISTEAPKTPTTKKTKEVAEEKLRKEI